jgi:hypothetical protein
MTPGFAFFGLGDLAALRVAFGVMTLLLTRKDALLQLCARIGYNP